MKKLPSNWFLVEEYDGNYIFENLNSSFCVNVNYIARCEYPYSISFIQLQGEFVVIGIENGAYTTHAIDSHDALIKAYEMMEFINSKVQLSVDVV